MMVNERRARRRRLRTVRRQAPKGDVMRWLVSRGWHGWVLVLVVVLAFDIAAAIYGGEPMTASVRRWFNHGIGRWFVIAVITYLVIHLTVMPTRVDPLDRTFAWIREKTVRPTVTPPPPRDAPGAQG
jgi:hypothetical protein